MEHSHPSAPGRRYARVALCVSAAVLAAAACAPDSVRSVQATGFNGYMQKIAQVCQPMQIGRANVGEWMRMNAMGNDDYTYFVDVTSKLYYNRLTQDGYRQAVVGFFGPGSTNDRAFDCMFRNLPPDRPNAPVGTY
jgi:hypothetical protein